MRKAAQFLPAFLLRSRSTGPQRVPQQIPEVPPHRRVGVVLDGDALLDLRVIHEPTQRRVRYEIGDDSLDVVADRIA